MFSTVPNSEFRAKMGSLGNSWIFTGFQLDNTKDKHKTFKKHFLRVTAKEPLMLLDETLLIKYDILHVY